MKVDTYIYWIATLVMSTVFLVSINIHLFQPEMAERLYRLLEFPRWWILPSGILKALALLAILSNKSKFLKEWAYAGLFFDVTMTFAAHRFGANGITFFSVIAIVSIVVSRIYWGKSGY